MYGHSAQRWESKDEPMSKARYDKLCAVSGFKAANGATYADYVNDGWWRRAGRAAPVDPRTHCTKDLQRIVSLAASELFGACEYANVKRHDTGEENTYLASKWDTPVTAYTSFTTALVDGNKGVQWVHGDRNGAWMSADGVVEVEINEHAMELLEWHELFDTGVALHGDVVAFQTYLRDAGPYSFALRNDADALDTTPRARVILPPPPFA